MLTMGLFNFSVINTLSPSYQKSPKLLLDSLVVRYPMFVKNS